MNYPYPFFLISIQKSSTSHHTRLFFWKNRRVEIILNGFFHGSSALGLGLGLVAFGFGLPWFGLVWFALVWFALVWLGLVWVWLRLVWFGLERFGSVCVAFSLRSVPLEM